MDIWVEYGVTANFEVPLIKASARDFATSADWTPVTADTKIVRDGSAATTLTNLPVAISLANTWSFKLLPVDTAVERAAILVVDTATKAVEDQQINIRTYGHPSAADPRGILFRGTASSGSQSSFVMPSGGGISSTDDAYNGAIWRVVRGTGANVAWGQVIDYVGSTRTFTVYVAGPPSQGRQSPVALDSTSEIVITAFPIQPVPITISGDAVAATLSSTERDAIASALLDLTNAIETGVTLRGATRLILSAAAGKVAGAGSTTETFRNAVADSKARITATVDASGNRTSIVTDLT